MRRVFVNSTWTETTVLDFGWLGWIGQENEDHITKLYRLCSAVKQRSWLLIMWLIAHCCNFCCSDVRCLTLCLEFFLSFVVLVSIEYLLWRQNKNKKRMGKRGCLGSKQKIVDLYASCLNHFFPQCVMCKYLIVFFFCWNVSLRLAGESHFCTVCNRRNSGYVTVLGKLAYWCRTVKVNC